MNIDISSVVHACEICQSHAAPQPKQYTYTMTNKTHRPMQTVGADIFQCNGETFLILMDYFSKYPWVRRLRNISATTTIDAMRTVFSEFGYPSHLHSDSGTQFTAREFQTFSQRYNFKHTKSSPYYHESNGKSERYVGVIKNLMRKNPGSLGEALLAYRCAPLGCNERTPAELMFNRQIKDHIVDLPIQGSDDRANEDEIEQPSSKYPPLHPGDRVFVFNTDTKMWEKGQIQHLTDQPSQYSVIFESGRIANRNRVHLKLDRTVPLTLSPDNPDKNDPTALLPDNPDITVPFTPQSDDNPTPPSPTNINNNIPPISEQSPNPTQELPQEPRRSSRETKKPSRFKDYVNI